MNLNDVFSNCLFCFDCDANKQATGLMKSTAQQHIRTWLSLPKKTEHIGGQYDDSFCPFIMVYPHLNPEDPPCGIHVTASGVEHQPCRARLTERTRRRHSEIAQNAWQPDNLFAVCHVVLSGRTLCNPTGPALGSLGHPGSARLILCPAGQPHGCPTPSPWDSNGGKPW